MRKRLIYYFFGEFIEIFSPIFFSLIFLGSAYRLTTLGDIEQVYLSLKNTVLLFLHLIPITTPIILPLAFLFSLTLLIIKLRLTMELTALFTLKIIPQRIIFVMLFFTSLLVVLGLANSLYLKPYSAQKLKEIVRSGSIDQIKNLRQKNIKKIADNTFLYAGDKKGDVLLDVLYCKSSMERGVINVISAKEMLIHDKSSLFQVTFRKGTFASIRGENATFSDFGTLSVNPFKEKVAEDISPRLIHTKSLFFITRYDRYAFREAVELCERIFLPFGMVIFLIYSFIFAVSNKKSGYISAILACLLTGIAYFAIFFIIYSSGNRGLLSPIFYFPLFFFTELTTGLLLFWLKFRRVF